jgi:hypothetical protein
MLISCGVLSCSVLLPLLHAKVNSAAIRNTRVFFHDRFFLITDNLLMMAIFYDRLVLIPGEMSGESASFRVGPVLC